MGFGGFLTNCLRVTANRGKKLPLPPVATGMHDLMIFVEIFGMHLVNLPPASGGGFGFWDALGMIPNPKFESWDLFGKTANFYLAS